MSRLEELLDNSTNLKNAYILAKWVGDDPDKYQALWRKVTTAKEPYHRRAIYGWEKLVLNNPDLLKGHVKELIDFFINLEIGPAATGNYTLLRHLGKVLISLPIPEELHGRLYTRCMDLLLDLKTPIAVQAHCLELAAKIAAHYPALIMEIDELITADLPHHQSAGFKSRARKIQKKILVEKGDVV